MDNDYKAIANEIIERGINLFGNYDDWFKGAFALSNLGEEGRDIFYSISSLSPDYNERDSCYMFNYAIRSNREIGIGTFLHMCQNYGINIAEYRTNEKHSNVQLLKPEQLPKLPPSYIDWDFVQRSASFNSTFVEFLCGVTDYETIKRLGDEYALGATKDKGVIFWQIDVNGKVRTGKIMHFDAETGHRIKNRGNNANWVHYKLTEKGLINGFNLSQCLFGEHLLRIYPEKVVALVESEKTALIGAVIFPQYVWCATGGKENIIGDIERMKVLSGRSVVIFPDTDIDGKTFDDWRNKAKSFTFCKCHVSDILERYATKAEKMAKIDIGDWLIKSLEENPHQTIKIMTDQERILSDMIKENPAIGLLVEVFNLEIVA